MRPFARLLRDTSAAAASELALIFPMMLILMFGSMELGNFVLMQHALTKQVRDGARYASRLTLEEDYACPGAVFADGNAETNIENVTKTGTVDGTGTGRFTASAWSSACPSASASAFDVSVRCVPEGTYTGIYTGLAGDIPVVSVSANLQYQSVLAAIGFDASALCIRATSEAAVIGL